MIPLLAAVRLVTAIRRGGEGDHGITVARSGSRLAPKLSRNMAPVEVLKAVGARHGGVTPAIVGFRTAAQMDGQ